MAFAMKTDVAPLAPSCLGLMGVNEAEGRRDALTAYARQLARIEAALARMDSGRYGFCVSCDRQIALTRLEADPAETVCETCEIGKDA